MKKFFLILTVIVGSVIFSKKANIAFISKRLLNRYFLISEANIFYEFSTADRATWFTTTL